MKNVSIAALLDCLTTLSPWSAYPVNFWGVGSFESLSGSLNTKFTQIVEVDLRRRESVFNNQAYTNITGILDI